MTEFEEMCKKANVKVEELCDTVLTRHFKEVNGMKVKNLKEIVDGYLTEDNRTIRDEAFGKICHILHETWGELSNGEVANIILDLFYKYLKEVKIK